jgi:hypothetical protein
MELKPIHRRKLDDPTGILPFVDLTSLHLRGRAGRRVVGHHARGQLIQLMIQPVSPSN